MPVPPEIVCIDCGGRCGLLTPEPPEGFQPGDVVAYRCSECLDRWDLEITEDDVAAPDGVDPGSHW
jgi:DNA-directed RNA polymerase subunit RPC12/RpoP